MIYIKQSYNYQNIQFYKSIIKNICEKYKNYIKFEQKKYYINFIQFT